MNAHLAEAEAICDRAASKNLSSPEIALVHALVGIGETLEVIAKRLTKLVEDQVL